MLGLLVVLTSAPLGSSSAWALEDQDRADFAKASQALQLGELDAAEAAFRDLQRRLPSRPEIINNLGVIAQQRGNLEQAAKLLAEAARLEPHYLSIYNNARRLSYGARLSEEPPTLVEALPGPATPLLTLAEVHARPRQSNAFNTLSRHSATKPGAAALDFAALSNVAPVVANAGPSSKEPALPLEQALERWRQAWQSQNIRAYLAWYASVFVPPPPATSKRAWEDKRRAVFAIPKTRVSIVITHMTISPDPTGELVEFRQTYSVNNHATQGQKTMRWRVVEGEWRILSEQFMRAPKA